MDRRNLPEDGQRRRLQCVADARTATGAGLSSEVSEATLLFFLAKKFSLLQNRSFLPVGADCSCVTAGGVASAVSASLAAAAGASFDAAVSSAMTRLNSEPVFSRSLETRLNFEVVSALTSAFNSVNSF